MANVPDEPTEEMLDAGRRALDMWVDGWLEKVYKAMLAAAPQPAPKKIDEFDPGDRNGAFRND